MTGPGAAGLGVRCAAAALDLAQRDPTHAVWQLLDYDDRYHDVRRLVHRSLEETRGIVYMCGLRQ